MTTWKQLSRPLRLFLVAPWLLLAALASMAAAPSFRALLLNPSNQPTADVSLSSSHWTGTLDAARLPLIYPLRDGTDQQPNGSLLSSGGALYLQANMNPADASAYRPALEQWFLRLGDDGINANFGVYRNHDSSDAPYPNTPLLQVSDRGDAHLRGGLFVGLQQLGYGSGPSYNAEFQVCDADGNLRAASFSDRNGSLVLDGDGDLFIPGSATFDHGQIRTDGSGTLSVSRGLSVWGTSAPSSQPAAPATLDEVVTLLRGYGFCQ